jgi:hypothetical protein
MAISSNAATITLSRGSGNPGVIASVDGTALASGGYYWATGTFTNALGVTEVPTITTEFSSLLEAVAAFDVFASTVAPITGATIGTITGSTTGLGAPDPNVFNSKQMFVLVGNGATQAASTAFGIFSFVANTVFPANVAAAGTTVVPIPNGAAITPLTNAGTVTLNNFGLVIPEPSAALLGMLGALGLLRRRRN